MDSINKLFNLTYLKKKLKNTNIIDVIENSGFIFVLTILIL